MTHPINLDKAREAVTLLDAWKGGERRDIDAVIAEALGWNNVGIIPGWGAHPDGYRQEIPRYLGTDPSIATEPMQRVCNEHGFLVCMSQQYDGGMGAFFTFYTVFDIRSDASGDAENLPLAFFRAVLAREDAARKYASTDQGSDPGNDDLVTQLREHVLNAKANAFERLIEATESSRDGKEQSK